MTDLEAKVYIAQVRTFYEDLVYYTGLNLAFILIWLFFSASWSFWPGWVILGWGAVLLRRAFMLKLFSMSKLTDWMPFFSQDWEERQLQKLITEDPPTISKIDSTEK